MGPATVGAGATAPSAPWWEALIQSRGRLCEPLSPACRSSSLDTAPRGQQAADLAAMFDAAGTGAVVNSARAILYAYKKARISTGPRPRRPRRPR